MFEWDEVKRRRTLADRGIDFAHMDVLWDGRAFLEAEDTRKPYPEPRFARLARINGRLFVVGWTPMVHNPANTVRIFSARKANAREEKAYRALIPE